MNKEKQLCDSNSRHAINLKMKINCNNVWKLFKSKLLKGIGKFLIQEVLLHVQYIFILCIFLVHHINTIPREYFIKHLCNFYNPWMIPLFLDTHKYTRTHTNRHRKDIIFYPSSEAYVKPFVYRTEMGLMPPLLIIHLNSLTLNFGKCNWYTRELETEGAGCTRK